jgi:hypothetical protein
VKDTERIKAINLRRKGYSINEIKRFIPVSKGTLSLWFKNVQLSKRATRRLRDQSTKGQLASQEWYRNRRNKIAREIEEYSNTTLTKLNLLIPELRQLLCALIYYCEGTKTLSGDISFTNSDPELIRYYLNLLRTAFNIKENKLRVCMHLHTYHNESKQKLFWSKVTGILSRQFIKTHWKESGRYSRKGYQGCIQVRYHDADLKRRLLALAKLALIR